jgi:hypothetical protein
MDVFAQIVIPGSCKGLCGWLVIISAMVIFPGTVWMLTSAVFGNRMGYLISATSFFAFMLILSALWVFGAPGTPKYLGPKGDLPAWVGLAAGQDLSSAAFPVVEEYPGGPWKPAEEAGFKTELEPATLAFQEFLAEEATAELAGENIDAEVEPAEFTIEGVRFTEVDERPVAMASGFAADGGPEVLVFGYKDPGNEPLPSYLFLVGSIIGFVAHLPFLDRAEKKRKELLTGGDQPPFRGPA